MGHWLRYGLFGYQALRIVNGDETWFRFFVLICFVALLALIGFLMAYRLRYGVIAAVAFVLCFGYLMGLALVISAGIVLLIGIVPSPPGPPEIEDDELGWSDVYTLNDLGDRARGRLSEAEYATMESEARRITTKAELESFVSRWENRI